MKKYSLISSLDDLAKLADYSLMDTLNCDPDATEDGDDHLPRQVFSGHYVPVKPTPIQDPEYIAHSKNFFAELGLVDSLATSPDFIRMFSGDSSELPEPMSQLGWATGYALSIYGTEYTQQCPFRTGDGYGDGRAISIFEGLLNGKRWEMQLKGGGPTPYCRGADGRAVLRSSVREFLAQDHMHALGIPTSRSLSFYVSKSETVQRPWFSEGSCSEHPDRLVTEAVAISTRVAPSFLRVGQVELFARRSRQDEDSKTLEELEKIVLHVIDREYPDLAKQEGSVQEKALLLAREFRARLSSLVANWIRVGFCQGNFNSDNCAAGGFTLDYGPFGFMDFFNPYYQPWTGGGQHFSFLNQGNAAYENFKMFCRALKPLLASDQEASEELNTILDGFSEEMKKALDKVWAAKLGLNHLDTDGPKTLIGELHALMLQRPVDYTIFFRELSSLPDSIEPLRKSFYHEPADEAERKELDKTWTEWFEQWKALIDEASASSSREEISKQMKLVNPKYILREWFLVPAYQQAATGDYSLVRELQEIMTQPYAEQSKEVEEKYYRLKPAEFFKLSGVSHMTCSS